MRYVLLFCVLAAISLMPFHARAGTKVCVDAPPDVELYDSKGNNIKQGESWIKTNCGAGGMSGGGGLTKKSLRNDLPPEENSNNKKKAVNPKLKKIYNP